jgi:hypothetical protein
VYSDIIVDKRLFAARKAGLKYKREDRSRSIEIAHELEALRYDRRGHLIPDGNTSRPFDPREQAFVDSERLLCKNDFKYWYERYANVELDPGVCDNSGIGPPVMAESQHRYVDLFGRREEQCHEELAKHKFTEGILVYVHKCRQVMATALVRGVTQHRMLFWPGTRAFAASLDADRVGELFKRDHLILDNLPFWMSPKIYPDVKDSEIGFAPPISSRISYQAENQTAGIGVGSQVDVSHLTEVALWQYPGRIRYSFVPAMPKAITTLHVQESTADGKGNYWHEVTEAARHKRRGYESWIYAFIPWYYNKLKYRANPSPNWVPEEHTLRHAVLIERTSPEFLDGRTYHLTREQLFWWESARALHAQNGELATFLTNYPATPEQSFQSPSAGALPVELIERMEQRTKFPDAVFEPEILTAA